MRFLRLRAMCVCVCVCVCVRVCMRLTDSVPEEDAHVGARVSAFAAVRVR